MLEISDRRDARFAQLLSAAGRLGTVELAALMADHGPTGQPGEFAPCMHSDYWHTTACVQFLPGDRLMRIAFGSACRAEYQELSL